MSSFKQKTYLIEERSDDTDKYILNSFWGNIKDLAVKVMNIENGTDNEEPDEFYDEDIEPYINSLESKSNWKSGVYIQSYEGDPPVIIYDFEITTRLKDE